MGVADFVNLWTRLLCVFSRPGKQDALLNPAGFENQIISYVVKRARIGKERKNDVFISKLWMIDLNSVRSETYMLIDKTKTYNTTRQFRHKASNLEGAGSRFQRIHYIILRNKSEVDSVWFVLRMWISKTNIAEL